MRARPNHTYTGQIYTISRQTCPVPNRHRQTRHPAQIHATDSIGNQCTEWTVVSGWSSRGIAIQSAPSDVEQGRVLSIDRRLIYRNMDTDVQPAVPGREVVF